MLKYDKISESKDEEYISWSYSQMQYKISNRTDLRILKTVLKKSSQTDQLKNELTALMNDTQSPQFADKFENFISENQISSLFSYENKLTGFFLKLDASYDKERKIAILSRLNECLSERNRFLEKQYTNQAEMANILIKKIETLTPAAMIPEHFNTNIPTKHEEKQNLNDTCNRVASLNKGKQNSKAANLPKYIYTEVKKQPTFNPTRARREWQMLARITEQMKAIYCS